MQKFKEDQTSKVHDRYLTLLMLGAPVIAIAGMLSELEPTSQWSIVAFPISLLLITPLAPQTLKNIKRKTEIPLFLKIFVFLLGVPTYIVFIYFALTLGAPAITKPFVSSQFEHIMIIKNINHNPSRYCKSGNRVSLVETTSSLTTTLCLKRDIKYKLGEKVLVTGYKSWFAYYFDGITYINKSS